jgi:preprotein translocase subunit SecG
MMFITFAVVQIVICALLVLVILLQEGKKGMGAIFGGSSTSIFGARGAGNILTKITSVLAILFMLNSVWLSYLSSKNTSVVDVPAVEKKEEAPAAKPVETAPVKAEPVAEEKAEAPKTEEAPKEEAPVKKEEKKEEKAPEKEAEKE